MPEKPGTVGVTEAFDPAILFSKPSPHPTPSHPPTPLHTPRLGAALHQLEHHPEPPASGPRCQCPPARACSPLSPLSR
eukprot:2983749-Rhodomonas_salina.1